MKRGYCIMWIVFIIFLNVITVFMSGLNFVYDLIRKEITSSTCLNLFLCLLNIGLFAFNVWRLKNEI